MTTESAATTASAEKKNGRLLEVEGLKMYFPVTAGLFIQRKVGDVKAVDGLTFHIQHGERLGLGGESCCGKSPPGSAIWTACAWCTTSV